MKHTIKTEGNAVSVKLAGFLGAGPDLDEVRASIKRELDAGARNFVIDLKEVKAINSTGLGVLVALYTAVTSKNGEMVLTNVSKPVLSTMRVVRLDQVFRIADEGEAGPESRNES
ncbi:MAG: STAS domain-containing protein [Candidatus Eisenbacteria bacterium]